MGSAGTASLTNLRRPAAGVAEVHELDFSAGQERRREETRTEIAPTVVHLDVKPGNFIFMADDTMKLHDFNLAHFLDASFATGDLCDMKKLYCNIYRSPEECTGSTA